jgi:hypothetical protein
MECKLKNRTDILSNYLTDELSEEEAKAFEEHYFQCEICFRELKAAEDAMNLIKEEGPPVLGAGKPSRKNLRSIFQKLTFPNLSAPKRWGIAAVAAIVLIFLITSIYQKDQKIFNDKIISQDKKPPAEMDSVNESQEKPEPEKNIFAELTGPAFEPNPYMEEWITENTRSGSERIDTVFTPKIGEQFNNERITFKWAVPERDKEPVSLKVMNNIEKEIFKSIPDTSQLPLLIVTVKPDVLKESGLYYWRIEDEDEVLCVGKFYFLKMQ